MDTKERDFRLVATCKDSERTNKKEFEVPREVVNMELLEPYILEAVKEFPSDIPDTVNFTIYAKEV